MLILRYTFILGAVANFAKQSQDKGYNYLKCKCEREGYTILKRFITNKTQRENYLSITKYLITCFGGLSAKR